MNTTNLKRWVVALTMVLSLAGMMIHDIINAAPGDVTVFDEASNPAYTKKRITFTLNGTTPVTAAFQIRHPVRSGSVQVVNVSAAGSITYSLFKSDFFAAAEKDLVNEGVTSGTLRTQVGIFENIPSPGVGPGAAIYGTFAESPGTFTFRAVSSGTADTTTTGTAL